VPAIRDAASSLRDDHLHLFVFGPGYGEGIAIGAPGNQWLLVDSLGRPDLDPTFIPSAELLEARETTADILILTHPHDDHVVGLDRLVHGYLDGPLGAVDSFLGNRPHEVASAKRANNASARRKALAAVAVYWKKYPHHQWYLRADGSSRPLGDATVTVVHPSQAFADGCTSDPESRPNELSAPLLVRWKDVRLVLGADLPTAQWKLARPTATELAEHHALKVAHHGSGRSIADDLLKAPTNGAARIWIVAPWFKGGCALPDPDAEKGLQSLLRHNDAIELTAPGRRLTSAVATQLTRNDFAGLAEVVVTPNGKKLHVRYDADPDAAWVAASFGPSGSLVAIQRGREAITVKA
jgi:hypothetical protein